MKKMLAKAVALSLVLGGVGFVANDASAATTDQLEKQIQQEANYRYMGDFDLQTNINNEAKVREEADSKLGDRIDANKTAIDKEVKDRQDAITQERNARVEADNKLGDWRRYQSKSRSN